MFTFNAQDRHAGFLISRRSGGSPALPSMIREIIRSTGDAPGQRISKPVLVDALQRGISTTPDYTARNHNRLKHLLTQP